MASPVPRFACKSAAFFFGLAVCVCSCMLPCRSGEGGRGGGGGAVEGGDSVHRMRLASSVSFWLRAGGGFAEAS